MVYELEPDEEAQLVETKRRRQLERALDFVDMVGATHVFPTAGPPCFLDDELFELNDSPRGARRSSPMPRSSSSAGAHGHTGGHMVVPGSVAELTGEGCTVSHLSEGRRSPHRRQGAYPGRYRDDMAEVIAAERASWPTDRTDLLAELKGWIEPLLADAAHPQRIGGAIGPRRRRRAVPSTCPPARCGRGRRMRPTRRSCSASPAPSSRPRCAAESPTGSTTCSSRAGSPPTATARTTSSSTRSSSR